MSKANEEMGRSLRAQAAIAAWHIYIEFSHDRLFLPLVGDVLEEFEMMVLHIKFNHWCYNIHTNTSSTSYYYRRNNDLCDFA